MNLIRRAWSDAEDALFDRLLADGVKPCDMEGRIQGRTVSAIVNRMTVRSKIARVAASIPPPPAPIDWDAARAEQAAKPVSERWPYAMPGLVERVPLRREATWVPSASSIA